MSKFAVGVIVMVLGFTLAEYDSSGYGFAYNGERNKDKKEQNILKQGDKGFIPNIPMGSSDEDSSTTKSAIADGTIVLTKPSEQKQDVTQLNRNTQDTLNKLDKIFDKKEIEEKQELAGLFAELSFNAIHELSTKKEGNEVVSKWTPTQRAMAHAAVGFITASLADSKTPISTALANGVNVYVVSEISKNKELREYFNEHPDELQWISAGIGAGIGGLTGGNISDVSSGASAAASGTKNNALWELIPEFRKSVENLDMSDLKQGEVKVMSFNGSAGIVTGSDIALVLNSPDKDVYSGFSAGTGISMLPVDVGVYTGHIIDAKGNVVTNIDEIKKALSGFSMGSGVSGIYGGSYSGNPNSGYTLVLNGVNSNLGINLINIGYMWNVGSQKKGVVPYDFSNLFKNK